MPNDHATTDVEEGRKSKVGWYLLPFRCSGLYFL